jgi:ADP-heptose:LPS heptosyltransferase
MKILLIKRDKIGDLLLTTPIFSHLRAALPDAEIHLLANDYNAWVAADHPALNRIWIYPRAKVGKRIRWGAAFDQIRVSWRLRKLQFDFAVVAQGEFSPRAVRRSSWVGAKRTVAFVDPGNPYFSRLSDSLPPPRSGHETTRLFSLLQPLGVDMPAAIPYPSFTPGSQARRFAQTWLTERGLRSKEFVLFGLGTRRARRQPTADQIERWAAAVYRRRGLKALLIWTPGSSSDGIYPGDDDVVAPLLSKGLLHLFPYRGPIPETLGLIWQARTSLIPDSGLMHFAAASPGGVLGLFAETPSRFEQWAPRGPNVIALNATKSIAEVSDELVLGSLDRLLGSSS